MRTAASTETNSGDFLEQPDSRGAGMKFGETNYWRETQRPARFLFMDARIVVFLGLALLHFSAWTLALLVFAGVALIWMERRGIDPGNSLRHVRTFLAGPHITARGRSEQRMPVDYGFEANGASNASRRTKSSTRRNA